MVVQTFGVTLGSESGSGLRSRVGPAAEVVVDARAGLGLAWGLVLRVGIWIGLGLQFGLAWCRLNADRNRGVQPS